MEKESPQPGKPRFFEVCQMYNLDYQAMQGIADTARVPKHIVDAMSVSVAVRRAHASSVLAALGDHTGQTWTLDNVQVALLPTFQNVHMLHQFDLVILSTASGVSFDLIAMMLRDEPVSMKEAKSVLKAASQQTGQTYTVRNVDVKLTEEK